MRQPSDRKAAPKNDGHLGYTDTLSGGAGVGKSTVTNALYETLVRYLNSVPGENPDEVKVLKVAPTGKAAFNIKGNTLHSAFKIPANRGFQYCTLDANRLNTIRAQLRRLQVIFIDEISMVGSEMFNFLPLRKQFNCSVVAATIL